MNLEQQKTPLFARPLVMVAVAILCCALWGSATPAIKNGYLLLEVSGVASIMLFAGIRFFLAGIFTVAVNTGPLPDQVLLDAGANLLFHSMPEFNEAWETLKKVLIG